MPSNPNFPIAKLLTGLFPEGQFTSPESRESLAVFKGAYLLAIHLPKPVKFTIKKNAHTLGNGWFAYAGSANGGGGIRARLARHFRPDKKRHWHVDHLTAKADHLFALAIEHGSECEIIARLNQTKAFHFPIAGFGSSDCKTCCSHLMQPDETKADKIRPE